MRALRLLLAFGLLALANLAGSGEALACDRGPTVDTPTGFAQDFSTASHTQPRFMVWAAAVEPLDRVGQAGHHQVPHQHDHGCPDGCCTCFGNSGAPHVLIPGPGIYLALRAGGAYMALDPSDVATALACLPFRPPRAV